MAVRRVFQREVCNLSAGLTKQLDTANALIDRIFVTVSEGFLELYVGQGASAGGSSHFTFAASPIPYELRLPPCAYVVSVTAGDGRDLESVMVLTSG